jgi:hypothetical protein
MRILLSLLLLFGCGEDGDTDQQSEGGSSDQQSEGGSSDQQSELDSYESIGCVLHGSLRDQNRLHYWFASIEGVHPTEVRVVVCAPYRATLNSFPEGVVDGVQACGSPQKMLYRDGSTEVVCRLDSGNDSSPTSYYEPRPDDVDDWVVYYKRL